MFYKLLIWTIIGLKILYMVYFLRDHLGWYKDKEELRTQREHIMFISELLMYSLLIIVFLPRGPIVVSEHHEKHIFILLGVLGIIQTIQKLYILIYI